MNLKSIIKGKEKVPYTTAIILAAGRSERMGKDKMLEELSGIPVIIRTLYAFQRSDYISEIVVVTAENKIDEISKLCSSYEVKKVTKVISGGKNRTESAFLGVCAVSAKSRVIAIHDGARPLVSDSIIRDTVMGAYHYLTAVPAVPASDTTKVIDENGVIVNSIDRSTVVNIQTPQAFDSYVIKGALSSAISNNLSLTDDSSAVELMGGKIHTVPGDINNIKLTYSSDFIVAEQILKNKGDI